MGHTSPQAPGNTDEAMGSDGLPVSGNRSADASEHPRLVEEHHVIGPYGEDDIEATDERGRRWYHLRPEPRRRADFFGYNYTWWFLIWVLVVFVVFLPWGRGWGY